MNYAIKGGVGDFLQCLPFMLAHRDDKYYVASHHSDPVAFFAYFGIDVIELPLGRMAGMELCPRALFFERNPFPHSAPVFRDGKPVIGVHLGGSNYSLSVEKRFGFPPKALPKTLLTGLVEVTLGEYNFLLFGSPVELGEIGRVPGVWPVKGNLNACLAQVATCTALVGSDSAFKTMSAMLRIPTIVLMGNYRDDHRDERFISPYYQEKVLSYFRYKNLNDKEELSDAIKFCMMQLKALCLPCLT